MRIQGTGRILALAFCLLLAACTAHIPAEPTPLAELPSNEIPARQALTILVEERGDPLLQDGAELFAAKISEYTGEMLTAQVRVTGDAAADFNAGRGDLAFLDSRAASGLSDDFATLSTPLFYKDYDSFTMGLNSAKLLEMVGESLAQAQDTRLLAAFYQGSGYLVTTQPVSGGLPNSADMEEDSDLRPLALTRTVSGLQAVLERMDFMVNVQEDAGERLSGLTSGDVFLAEFTRAELEEIDWTDSGLNLVTVGHDMAPCWMVMRDSRYAELSTRYRAAIQEAVTYLFPVIDSGLLQREAALREQLRAQGTTVERSFPALCSAADALREQELAADSRKKYLYSIFLDMK